jgi:hypothetical protein
MNRPPHTSRRIRGRGAPRIAQANLRDHADEDRIERIWNRIESDWLPVPARSTRPGAHWVAMAAAALGAFGAGVMLGRSSGDEITSAPTPTTYADEVRVDVCAAGETPASCVLPGGGRIEVKPHTIVEVAHSDGQLLTLRLLQGEADITSSTSDGLAIVTGETRMSTQAGSVVSVRRNQADVDVSVAGGLVDVSSPDGQRRQLRSGERADRIPITAATAAAPTEEKKSIAAERPLALAAETEEVEGDPALVEEAPAPEPREDWAARYDSGDWDGAVRLVERDFGSLQAAIASVESPERMAAMADLADAAKQSDLARATRIRVIERWPHSPLAQGLAYQLGGEYYERYKAQLEQVLGQEQLECQRLYNYASTDNLSEAVTLAARAYLKRWPEGQCRDDADALIARFEAARPPHDPLSPAEAGEPQAPDDEDPSPSPEPEEPPAP